MKIGHFNYHSATSDSKRYAPRFKDQRSIQKCQARICKAWMEYLQNYLDRTTKLFGDAERP
jgi:hypothetical protein